MAATPICGPQRRREELQIRAALVAAQMLALPRAPKECAGRPTTWVRDFKSRFH